MEKRISCSQFMIVKNVAKAIDPVVRQKATIQAKINNIEEDYKKKEEEEMAKLKQRLEEGKAKKLEALNAELQAKDGQIEALESGVVKIIGFHVADLIKKIMEPNGKVDDKGNPIKVTKFLPTEGVKYDDSKKEYIIYYEETEDDGTGRKMYVINPDEEPKGGSDDTEPEAQPEAPVEEAPTETPEPTNEHNNLPWEN